MATLRRPRCFIIACACALALAFTLGPASALTVPLGRPSIGGSAMLGQEQAERATTVELLFANSYDIFYRFLEGLDFHKNYETSDSCF